MERKPTKTCWKISDFCLILVIILLYSDSLNILQTWQEKSAANARLALQNKVTSVVPQVYFEPNATHFQLSDQKQEKPDSLSSDRKSIFLSQNVNYFEPNMGQANEAVRFLSRGKNHTLFLTPSGALLNLTCFRKDTTKLCPVRECEGIAIRLTGSAPEPVVVGINKLAGVSNYLLGNDPQKWRTYIPHFEMVKYENVYDGIDLVYHNRKGNLEYDFIVAPGADPGEIGFSIQGAEQINEDESGNLILVTRLGIVMIKAPETYQLIHDEKMQIASEYRLDKGKNISIRLGKYDESVPLIIDPELVYSTYLGGAGDDDILGLAADDDGNVYATGYTTSSDFPGLEEGTSLEGKFDVFVTKLNTITSELIFTTILGGSEIDAGYHIGIDENRNISIAGPTYSDDFPVENAIQSKLGDASAGNNECGDIFALKLNPDGSSIIYSTYLGGREEELLFDAVFDNKGNTYLSGYTKRYQNPVDYTCSNSFPLYPKEFKDYPNSCYSKHFILKMNDKGELLYSVLVALESNVDNCLALNKRGNACLLKFSDLKVNTDAYATRFSLLEFDNTGTLVDSLSFTFAYESTSAFPMWTKDFQFDDQENIYITGWAEKNKIPATSNAYQLTSNEKRDGFVAKLNKNATEVLYATYLGGSMDDTPARIYVDNQGSVYIFGNTFSEDFPAKNAYQSTSAGGSDAFLTKIDPSKSGESSLLFSTYLGGDKNDYGIDFAFDSNENIYLSGYTNSTDFPVENAIYTSNSGSYDAYITVFSPEDTVFLIYDKVVNSGPPVFLQLQPPNSQQVLPQFLIRDSRDTAFFRFEGRSTDGRAGLRVTNTMVRFGPPLILDMKVIDPDSLEVGWTIQNLGEGNRGLQFDVTKKGPYRIKVWAEPESEVFPAPFQIHLSGNVGWPQPLLNGIPDTIRATRQDILINAPAPRPQLLGGRPGDVLINPLAGVSQTSLFKFTNISQVSEHAIAVLTPRNQAGFIQGLAPVRMLDPNPMPDITTPTAPFFIRTSPGGEYVDFTQVPIPAAINVPVQLRHAAVLGKSDGIYTALPVNTTDIPTIILDMGSGQEIVDGEGNDFRVYSPEGNYSVAVSNTVYGNTFIPIGEVFSGDQEFDLDGTGLPSARFVRIIAANSAEIDAVRALNYFCDEDRSEIGPISKVDYVTMITRRAKAPETKFDPFMEFIGPDGALNATNESGFGDDLTLDASDAAFSNMELNEEGFYRYLVRGHDKTPNEESFGRFCTRFESGGTWDATEIEISESEMTDVTAQRTVTITGKRQRDSYLFQAAPNQVINIGVFSTDIDVMLELYDPEEFMIAACDNHPDWGTDALITVRLPDFSFLTGNPMPSINTYRIVVSAIDHPSDKKQTQEGNAYIRQPSIGSYQMKVTSNDEFVGILDRRSENIPYLVNYPDPFNHQTVISYELQAKALVTLEIYDLKGQMILSLVNETQRAGKHTICWNGNDKYNNQMPNGMYICRMIAGNDIRTEKVILNREE